MLALLLPQSLNARVDERGKVRVVALLNLRQLPVVARSDVSADGRSTATALLQSCVRLAAEEGVINCQFFASRNSTAGDERHFVCHPQGGVTRMIERAPTALHRDLRQLHEVELLINLNRIKPREGLHESAELSLGHDHTAENFHHFALRDGGTSKRPDPLDG